MRVASFLLLLAAGLVGCGDSDDARDPLSGPQRYDAEGRWLGGSTSPPERPMNLIVILIDTLRADAVALGDEPGGRMPYLASLAKEGVAFRQASAPAPWTLPSIATLFTGLLPWEHGCDRLNQPSLSASVTTYAEALRNTHGYDCTAFVDGPWFQGANSMLQGFEVGGLQLGLGRLPMGLSRWRRDRDEAQPFFLFIHTFDAHDPYGQIPEGADPDPAMPTGDLPPDWEVTRDFMMFARRREKLFRVYGNDVVDAVFRYTYEGFRDAPRPELAEALSTAYFDGVAWVDGLLERTVKMLADGGLLENTLLVVTSDHGETFGDHGMLGHGRQLYDPLVRVPLILKGPGGFDGGAVLDESVGLVDVMPTFFATQGYPQLADSRGRSLLPFLEGKGQGRPVLAQERIDKSHAPVEKPIYKASVRDGHFKYIATFDASNSTLLEELFDLRADPQERRGVSPDEELGGAFCEAIEEAHAKLLEEAGRPGDTPSLICR